MWVYLVHLSPEAMFQVFLCLSQSLVVLECIQMSQHTHDTRETVYLTDIEKLKCLHLKAKAGINQHQNLETKGSNAFLLFYFTILPDTYSSSQKSICTHHGCECPAHFGLLITSLNCYFRNWVRKFEFMLDCLQHTKGCMHLAFNQSPQILLRVAAGALRRQKLSISMLCISKPVFMRV